MAANATGMISIKDEASKASRNNEDHHKAVITSDGDITCQLVVKEMDYHLLP